MSGPESVTAGLGIASSLLSIIDKSIDSVEASKIAAAAKIQIEDDHKEKARQNRIIHKYMDAIEEKNAEIKQLKEKLAKYQ